MQLEPKQILNSIWGVVLQTEETSIREVSEGKITSIFPTCRRIAYQDQNQTGNFFQNSGRNQNHGNHKCHRYYKGQNRNYYTGNSIFTRKDSTMLMLGDMGTKVNMMLVMLQMWDTTCVLYQGPRTPLITLLHSYIQIPIFSYAMWC